MVLKISCFYQCLSFIHPFFSPEVIMIESHRKDLIWQELGPESGAFNPVMKRFTFEFEGRFHI